MKQKSIDENDLDTNSTTDSGKGIIYFIWSDINIVLIDDQADTYYPFISLIVYKTVTKVETQKFGRSVITHLDTIFKIVSYNYLATMWEPLIEKSLFRSKIIQINDQTIKSTSVDITVPLQEQNIFNTFNINVSDMNVSLLLLTTYPTLIHYLTLIPFNSLILNIYRFRSFTPPLTLGLISSSDLKATTALKSKILSQKPDSPKKLQTTLSKTTPVRPLDFTGCSMTTQECI